MTDIRKSDAQLDAEAGMLRCHRCGGAYIPEYPHRHADPPPRGDYNPMPPRPNTVAGLIDYIRHEYAGELPDRLHVRYVPSQVEDGMLDAGQLGAPSWAPEFARRVGAVRLDDIEPGDWAIFPWGFAIERRLEPWCRRVHRLPLWTEHRGDPLCKPMVKALMGTGVTVADVALAYEMTPERAELVLADSLGKVWGWVSNVLNEIDLRPAA